MTIIKRSALVFHGHNPAPDVAEIVVDHRGRHVVTWDDVLAARRERQRRQLEDKRRVVPWRPAKLWVAYFDQWLFGGWQAFVEDRRESQWIDRDRKFLKCDLMKLFPCTLFDTWEDWKPRFAQRFARRRQCGRPVGVAFVWVRGYKVASSASAAPLPLPPFDRTDD